MDSALQITADSSVWTTLLSDIPWVVKALFIAVVFYALSTHLTIKGGKVYWYSPRKHSEERTTRLKEIQDTLQKVSKKIDDLTMADCKIHVYMTEMPLIERIYAGIKYINCGGNGDVKRYINKEFREKHPDLFENITKILEKKETVND